MGNASQGDPAALSHIFHFLKRKIKKVLVKWTDVYELWKPVGLGRKVIELQMFLLWKISFHFLQDFNLFGAG